MSHYDEVMQRIYEATGVKTQAGLAQILGIAQPTVSDAKKRNSIPSKWFLKLFRLRGVNPEWLEHGAGPKYIGTYPADGPEEASSAVGVEGGGYGPSMPEGARVVPVCSMSEFNIEDPEGCEKVDSFCVPKEFDGEGLLVVRMAGTNMEPLIRRDALVGIDLNRKKVISGEIYGLVLPYEGLVIRRVYLEPEEDRLVMSSENQSHADKHGPLQEYSSRIAGRVAWVMQDI